MGARVWPTPCPVLLAVLLLLHCGVRGAASSLHLRARAGLLAEQHDSSQAGRHRDHHHHTHSDDMSLYVEQEEPGKLRLSSSPPPAPLPCAGDLAEEAEKTVHFMLLGQQKCGTSSLWNLLTAHPHIRMAGHRKENFYWSPGGTFHEEMRWDSCILPIEGYRAFLEADHAFRDVCAGDKIGDFTATHFSCPCCPEKFRLINPEMKLVVVLREPRARSESRFTEQRSMKGRYSEVPFGELAQREIEWMQSHSCQANRYLPPGIPQLDAARELHCNARSNIVGWSNYPVYIRNWLAHFPPQQLLVVYTEQFERDPLLVLRALESFLGVEDYQYPQEVLSHTHYNTGDCGYGWNVGDDSKCDQGAPRAPEAAYFDNLNSRHHRDSPNDPFFDTVVEEMLELAREGKIALPPLSWFAKGRLERIGVTREQYLEVQRSQTEELQGGGLYHSQKLRRAVRGMVKEAHIA